MKRDDIEARLSHLFKEYTQEDCTSIVPLAPSGSNRQYFRLQNSKNSIIGVFNADLKENIAFISFTKSLQAAGIRVPEILIEYLDAHVYLQSDLGDMTLFEYIKTVRKGNEFPEELREVYTKIVKQLPHIQTQGAKKIDFSVCYPRPAFDRQSMHWDLNYFKYYFLKLAGVAFDEQELENDFQVFMEWLDNSPAEYFLYRDFQSRNIMLVNNEPYFIDYQGGRKGALQYDIASLLYDAKAGLSEEIRHELLQTYLDELETIMPVQRDEFQQLYYGFVLIRIMQAMGAYGYRGFFERKEHFLQSIPFALDNLNAIMQRVQLPIEVPTLTRIWKSLPLSSKLRKIGSNSQRLRVKIQSFSYKRGLPQDGTEHGGGFIFDCRSIHNPGRYTEYKTKSGKDKDVIEFFAKEKEMHDFLTDVYSLVDKAVAKYIDRKFDYLSVSFGCTGGQHRSVFSAENLAKHLKEKYNVELELSHRETKYWKK